MGFNSAFKGLILFTLHSAHANKKKFLCNCTHKSFHLCNQCFSTRVEQNLCSGSVRSRGVSKIFKYRKIFKISREMSQGFFCCGNWRKWSNLLALRTASISFFLQPVLFFKVLLTCIVTVLLLGFYRNRLTDCDRKAFLCQIIQYVFIVSTTLYTNIISSTFIFTIY